VIATPPSEDEKNLAAGNGVTLDVTAVALDGFVFITHKDNPVDSLTAEQVRKIYTGEIKNWSELGGNPGSIRAYQRNPNSGSQTAMEELVMKGLKMKEPIKTETYREMGGLVDAVAEYQNGKNSIGYTYDYYIKNLYKNENIKTLKIDGVAPSFESYKNRTYPFTATYCAVIRTDEPEGSPARRLSDFLLTEQGQRLVEMAGYCGRGEQNE
jgi:phosphate transport system substrate-binding protein